jgi:RNA-dependent RNA polymerase
MRYIYITHALVDTPDVHLKEEVVLGTILANFAQSRWRSDRTYGMKLHVEGLVDDIRGQIVQIKKDADGGAVSLWFVARVGGVGLGLASPR